MQSGLGIVTEVVTGFWGSQEERGEPGEARRIQEAGKSQEEPGQEQPAGSRRSLHGLATLSGGQIAREIGAAGTSTDLETTGNGYSPQRPLCGWHSKAFVA